MNQFIDTETPELESTAFRFALDIIDNDDTLTLSILISLTLLSRLHQEKILNYYLEYIYLIQVTQKKWIITH